MSASSELPVALEDEFQAGRAKTLACVKRRSRREGYQEQGGGRGAGEQNCQAAGQDMVIAHRLAFVILAFSPLSFVNGQMGTRARDEHCSNRIGAMRVSNKAF